jgi:hypothetical protein
MQVDDIAFNFNHHVTHVDGIYVRFIIYKVWCKLRTKATAGLMSHDLY